MGNSKSVYTTLGASNHITEDRANYDFYATDPKAVEVLLDNEKFSDDIWECATGEGHIADVLKSRGKNVFTSDIIRRNYPIDLEADYLKYDSDFYFNGDIITNPPYKFAKEFVIKSLQNIPKKHKVAMLLKIQFLESISRRELFENNPPYKILVFSKRIACAKNGDFEKYHSSAICYAWFIWIKGFKGDPIIKWI